MIFKGVSGSPGVVLGKAFVLDREDFQVPRRLLSPEEVERDIQRFRVALKDTLHELTVLKEKLRRELGDRHASIFNAHLLMLDDPAFVEEAIRRVREESVNIEYVLPEVIKRVEAVFAQMQDDYLTTRISDIQDVGRRILRNLLGLERKILSDLSEDVIVVAHDLSPSETAAMHKERVIGLATDIGGPTSHTAIMARSLEIPAVLGLNNLSVRVSTGDTLIVDGNRGVAHLNPDVETVRQYEEERDRFLAFMEDLKKLKDLSSETRDGCAVVLGANVELPEELPHVIANGAEGIGLYRTEFMYLNRSELPDEATQFEAYKEAAEAVYPHSVIIRTLDLGGDKFLSHLNIPFEMNPSMGCRAIRFCLERPDIFKVQLRAILRASIMGNLKIMFPMISDVSEMRRINKILGEVKDELRDEGTGFDEDMEVGAMIEIPSAALTADIMATECDFFSIGTNDLIQYLLAVDRVNEQIAHLYQPCHPAVLRMIHQVVKAAEAHGVWVSVCGEVAGDPGYAVVLLGMGINRLSMAPLVIPEVKALIRSITQETARKLAERVLSLSTADEVKREIRQTVSRFAPSLASFEYALK